MLTRSLWALALLLSLQWPLAAQAYELSWDLDADRAALGLQAAPLPSEERAEHRLADALDEQRTRQIVLQAAENLLGTRYRYGTASDVSTDCSGMVGQAYREAGIELPRSTREMLRVGDEIARDDLQPGDLLFYRFRKGQLHVALYAGNNEILHASPADRKVVRTALTAQWDRRLIEARRVLPARVDLPVS